ncbi:hypothetical protein D3C80_1203890 [compost metagenome]
MFLFVMFYGRPGIEVSNQVLQAPAKRYGKMRNFNIGKGEGDCLVLFIDILPLRIPVRAQNIIIKVCDDLVYHIGYLQIAITRHQQ